MGDLVAFVPRGVVTPENCDMPTNASRASPVHASYKRIRAFLGCLKFFRPQRLRQIAPAREHGQVSSALISRRKHGLFRGNRQLRTAWILPSRPAREGGRPRAKLASNEPCAAQRNAKLVVPCSSYTFTGTPSSTWLRMGLAALARGERRMMPLGMVPYLLWPTRTALQARRRDRLALDLRHHLQCTVGVLYGCGTTCDPRRGSGARAGAVKSS